VNPEPKANMQINQAQMDDNKTRSVGSVHDAPALSLPFPLPLSDTHQRVEGMVHVFRALAVSVI